MRFRPVFLFLSFAVVFDVSSVKDAVENEGGAFSNLFKQIDKLSHLDTKRVCQQVKRYVVASTTV